MDREQSRLPTETSGSLQHSISLIFDLDGTLIDTGQATVPACQRVAARMGIPSVDADTIRQTIGWSEEAFYQKLYPDLDPDRRLQYGRQVEEEEAALIGQIGRQLVFAGIFELLDYLRTRQHFLAIASTGSAEHVRISLESTGLADYFPVVKCAEPEKTRMVADIIHSRPGQNWYLIGDKDKDAIAGRNNQIVTIGVEYGYGTAAERKLFDHRVGHPADILSVIAGSAAPSR